MRRHFPALPGERQTIVLAIDSVQTSCGYAVPMYVYQGERDTLAQERFVIRSTRTEPSGLLIGSVEAVSHEAATAIPDDLELAVEILRHIIAEYGDTHFPAPHEFDNAVWVGYRLSEVLPLKLTIKQNLLEMNDSVTRLRILAEFLKKQIN